MGLSKKTILLEKELGFLKEFDINAIEQVPFFLPDQFFHLPARLSDLSPDEDSEEQPLTVIHILIDGAVSYYRKNTRAQFLATGKAKSTINVLLDSNQKRMKSSLKSGKSMYLLGYFSVYRGEPVFRAGRAYPDEMKNKTIPYYEPGKKSKVPMGNLLDKMHQLLPDAIPYAVKHLKKFFDVDDKDRESEITDIILSDGSSISQLIKGAHYPPSVERGEFCRERLQWLSAYHLVYAGMKSRPGPDPESAIVFDRDKLEGLASNFGFQITQEQRRAAGVMIKELESDIPARHLLSGDVGSGKTCVYGLVAASVALAGKQVVILTPRTELVKQVYEDFVKWFPMLSIGRASEDNREKPEHFANSQIIIGTIGLASKLGDIKPALVIVDEQQKFSAEQRESISKLNIIEVTATCIPRTQAMVSYGIWSVSRLRGNHSKKTIKTEIMMAKGKFGLIKKKIQETIARGGKVLIVYPKVKRRDMGSMMDFDSTGGLRSLEESLPAWEKHFPDQITWMHGKSDEYRRKECMKQIHSGEKNILISTSLIEIGINIPSLELCIVLDPQQHGTKELHQFRGRLARNGGNGTFVLCFMSDDISGDALARAQILTSTTDGFEVADLDLNLKGTGELIEGARKQKGAVDGFIPNLPITIDMLESLKMAAR